MIVPKLTPDEMDDERELRDPKIGAAIREGRQEFLAGKTRLADMLQSELARIAAGQAGSGKPTSRRRPKA
jgi:hypothetical protein